MPNLINQLTILCFAYLGHVAAIVFACGSGCVWRRRYCYFGFGRFCMWVLLCQDAQRSQLDQENACKLYGGVPGQKYIHC